VVAAWLSAEQAYVAAERDPRGAYSPALPEHFIDPALQFIRRTLLGQEHAGDVLTGTTTFGAPRVVQLLGTQAIVSSCLGGTNVLVNQQTGRPIQGPQGTPSNDGIRSTVMETGPGVWKVSTSTVTQGSCVGY
jgi:hypothetical protein